MEFKTKKNLLSFLENELNFQGLPEKKEETLKRLTEVRLFLNDANAFHRSKLFSYRKNKAIPNTMLQGASLLYHSLKKDNNPTADDMFLSYAKQTGLAFQSIHSKCELKVGSRYPYYLDAETVTTYSHPFIEETFGKTIFVTKTLSEVSKANDIHTALEVFGPGLEIIDSNSPTYYKIQKSSNKRNKKVNYIESTFRIAVTKNTTKESQIVITKNIQNSFQLIPQVNTTAPLQKFGFTILKPVKDLELKFKFPKNKLLDDLPYFPLDIYCWGPGSHEIEDFDYHRISNLILGEKTKPISSATGEWHWKSQSPPILGMHYGFAYNCLALKGIFKGNL